MSLPPGVLNRPVAAAPDPAAVGGVVRLAVAALLVVLPWIFYTAIFVPGLDYRYESSKLEKAIIEARQERRQLLAEEAVLLDPRRLRKEAKRLGLVPSPPDAPPRYLPRTEGRKRR